MRKFIFLLMLFSFILAPCVTSAGTTEPFTDFELQTRYRANGNVYIRSGAVPNYGEMSGYSASPSFVGTLSENYSGDVPFGTFTVTDASSDYPGYRSVLRPVVNSVGSSDKTVRYNVYDYDNASLQGKKILVNFPTSPDILVKSFVYPDFLKFDSAEIVPYLTFTKNFGEGVTSYDFSLSFMKADAMGTPLKSPGVENVNLYLNYNYQDYEGNIYAQDSVSFDTFSGTKTYTTSTAKLTYGFDWAVVTYELNGNTYEWNFYQNSDISTSEAIEWGELEKPLELKEGDEKTFTIKIPASYTVANGNDKVFVNFGNGNVVFIEEAETELTQATDGTWEGLKYTENKSTLSFTITATGAGTTTLVFHMPGIGYDFLREVSVTGSAAPKNGEKGENLTFSINRYDSRAFISGGKPYYPSARFTGMNLMLNSEEDFPEQVWGGYFGIKRTSTSEIYPMYRNGNSLHISNGSGVRYDLSDPSKNKDAAYMNSDDFSDCYAWWEVPGIEGNTFNVVSASMSAFDIRTTEKQLSDFVPYFEYDFDNRVLNWKFVKVDGEKITDVTPEISNLVIYSDGYDTINTEEKSGTIENFYDDYFPIHFEYSYNGVSYSWHFGNMHSVDWRRTYISVNETRTENTYIYSNLSNAKSVNIVVYNEDLVSATQPAIDSSSLNLTFSIIGKKEGHTSFDIIFEFDGENLDDSFSRIIYEVYINEADSGEITIPSSDITAVIDNIRANVNIIEGRPYYKDIGGTLEMRLIRNELISRDEFYQNSDALSGTVHFFSGDTQIIHYIYPQYQESLSQVHYYFEVPFTTTSISWEFTKDVNKKGSFDLTKKTFQTPKEQAESVKPYVKFNRNGININSIEWYFADADGNKIKAPSSVSEFEIYTYLPNRNREVREVSTDKTAGSLDVNMPEAALNSVYVNFKSGDVSYSWIFDNAADNTWAEKSNVLSWDIDLSGMPFVMYVGDTKTVTVKASSTDEIIPFIGDSSIVEIGSAANVTNVASKTFTLTAKSAGMTSLTMYYKAKYVYSYGEYIRTITTYPREIWVAAKNSSTGKYEVPGLTTDLEALMSELTDGEFIYNGKDTPVDPIQPITPSNPGSGSSNGGNTQKNYEPISLELKSPSMDIRREEIKTKVRDSLKKTGALKNIIENSPNIEVVDITSDDAAEIGAMTTSNDISNDVPAGQQIAVTFNRIKITQPKIFVFNGTSALPAGSFLYWLLAEVKNASNASVVEVSDSGETGAAFFDENGNEIEKTASANQDFQVAAYITPGEYIPAVTSDAPGSELGSSGAGCNSGFISFALLGLALMLRKGKNIKQ